MRVVRPFLAVALFVACGAFAQTVPSKLNFTARLMDSGAPVQGSRDFVFKLFPTVMGGSDLWTETRNAVAVVDGVVNLDLGASTPLTAAVFDGQTLYLEVTVAGTVLSPRTPVLSVPYALRSDVASRIGVLTEPDIQKRVGSTCATGSAIRAIAADGTVTCQAAAVSVSDAGVTGITGVFGGAGLTGGAATGDVNLAVSFSGSGSATTVARSDHNHSGTYLPLGPTMACTGTDKVVSINPTTGSVVCMADPSTSYGALANGGLALSGSNQFSLTGCTGGQVLIAGAAGSWACGSPGVLSLSANPPLSVSSGANPVLSLGTVPLANGGTGGTTAATARAGIGAASSGANSDITSISGLTTLLSASQGGTGISPPTTPGNFLKSNGAGGWAAGTITAAELPSGSSSYIQNQIASAQAASLFVSGTVRNTGMTRQGSETGTSEPPRVDSAGGFSGLISRRINSTTIGLGSIVARTDMLSLERDGTNTGFRLRKVGTGNLRQTLVCKGVTAAGVNLNRVIDVSAGAATGAIFTVYTTADDVVMMDCVFGGMDTAVNTIGHHTSVTLARTNTGIIFFGTLTSTYNQ